MLDMTYPLLGDYNLVPNTELHWSLQLRPQSELKFWLRAFRCVWLFPQIAGGRGAFCGCPCHKSPTSGVYIGVPVEEALFERGCWAL